MNPWLESLAVLLLAAGGVLLGAWFSRLRKPYWLIGYFLPFLLIAIFAAANWEPFLAFIPPISWLMMGRIKFGIGGFIGAMVLTTPMMKLHNRRDRIAISCLMAVIVFMTSIWPFLGPAFNHDYLASLTTRIDSEGVCLQNTPYTCGPASAVTALRKLGFDADEGTIAILAHTTSTGGTPPDILADALTKKYAKEGLVCEYRAFKNLAELKHAGLTVAVVKFSFLLDHYVTVLDVTDSAIMVGDPLNGLTKLSPAEFAAKWRFEGVVLSRK